MPLGCCVCLELKVIPMPPLVVLLDILMRHMDLLLVVQGHRLTLDLLLNRLVQVDLPLLILLLLLFTCASSSVPGTELREAWAGYFSIKNGFRPPSRDVFSGAAG